MEPKLDGLTDLKLIRANARFSAFRGQYNQELVFVKMANDPSTKENIWTEVAGLQNMREIDIGEQHYRVPRVIYVDKDILITSWAEGELMRDQFKEGRQDAVATHLKTLLDLFTFIDGRTSGSIGYVRQNIPGGKNKIDDIVEKLAKTPYRDQIDPALVEATANYARRVVSSIESRFTHGDLQPGNLMTTAPAAIPTIIDCEHCSWLWPRHYNLVNFIFNYSAQDFLWLKPQLPDFFNHYFAELDIDPVTVLDQINFSAAMRSLQSIYESLGGVGAGESPKLTDYFVKFVSSSMERLASGQLFLDTNPAR